jgi:hypothetical protein
MRRLVFSTAIAILCSACTSVSPQATPRVEAADLLVAVGDNWKGTLTYRDYSPPYRDVTLLVEAKVQAVAGGLSVALHYPREPGADGISALLLTEGGRVFDGEAVILAERKDDTLQVITEGACQDDDRPAMCRHVYSFAVKQLGWRKLVTYAGDGGAVRRNEYTLTR